MSHVHVTEDKQFWLHDGRVLQTLHELQEVLGNIKAETFKHHVSPKHNDFSNWIKDILGDKKLADNTHQDGKQD